MIKILITSRDFGLIDKRPLKILEKKKFKIDIYKKSQEINENELIKKIRNIDVLIAGTEKISKKILNYSNKLKCISRVGIGLDCIDLLAARKKNIKVFNTPDEPTEGVVEFIIAQMFSCSRMIFQHNLEIKKKKWKPKNNPSIKNLKIGLLGLGRVGSGVLEKLNLLGIKKIFVHDINKIRKSKKMKFSIVSKKKLYKECDILSIHVPLNKNTKNMISAKELKLMKKEAIIINTSRGGIINENDLIKTLKKKKFKAVALDVFKNEPYKGDLIKFERCILTPHIASSTNEGRVAMEIKAVRNSLNYLNKMNLL